MADSKWALVGTAFSNMGWVSLRTLREMIVYGRSPWWWQLHLACSLAWMGTSPLSVLQAYVGREEEIEPDLTYGETLPGTAWELLKKAEANKHGRVVDLGCGRGVVALTAALCFGAESRGFDIVPEYARRGEKAAHFLGLEEQTRFITSDFRRSILPSADIYFLTGTCLEESSWQELLERLEAAAPDHCRVISVSRQLKGLRWQLMSDTQEAFSWGLTQVFIYERLPETKPSN